MATAHSTADTPHRTAGTTRAAAIPPDAARTGTLTAAIATPSGWHICRMPMASPRRSFGNQPMTTRPLAALGLADAIPPTRNSAPSATYESTNIAATAARHVRASPDA